MTQEKIADIYLDGRHYDQLFTNGSEDLPFCISQENQYGDIILELARRTDKTMEYQSN